MNGPQLFLRYAFRPNLLGHCGGEDNRALFEYGLAGQIDAGLLELERQFEGAYPYLQLIARANGISDPLDRRVVEAYWIGNPLLERVDMGALYRSLEERFRDRSGETAWRWLATKAPAGARPHHSFHVFDVFPRVGLMRSGAADRVLETMDQCRIRWGRVVSVAGPHITVDVRPLELRKGKLELGEARRESVLRWIDGNGFVDSAQPGDWVSVHWGWACDTLTREQGRNLASYTSQHLALCNRTL